MDQLKAFNIRVYGLVVNDDHELLLSYERINNYSFTKFPGGGLQLGEGTAHCIQREFKEELSLSIDVVKLFYVTDFFIQNQFLPHQQVIVIYYVVKPVNKASLKQLNLASKQLESLNETNDISHSWIGIENISPSLFTFEAEQKAASLIQAEPSAILA